MRISLQTEDEGDPFDEDLVWSQVLSFRDANFLMGASCGLCRGAGADVQSRELYKSLGLVLDHAYAVLDVRQVESSEGRPVRLVRLRNPWGRGVWAGDWSADSPR